MPSRSNTLRKTLPSKQPSNHPPASSSTSAPGTAAKRSSFGGSHSAGATLFRSSSTTTAGDALSSTTKNLRSFFKGAAGGTAADGSSSSSAAASPASTTDRNSRKSSADGLPARKVVVGAKGEPLMPTLVQPTAAGEPLRKRKTSLLRRPFSLSSSASTAAADGSRRALKTTTAPCAISEASPVAEPQLQVELPYSTLASSALDSGGRFTAPILRDGSLSSPALHLASDALSQVEKPTISSSSSVEALVSPARSRTSTVTTLRPVPGSPKDDTTPQKRRPAVPTPPGTPTPVLQSPINLDGLPASAVGAGRSRHATAPVSPTASRDTSSPESFSLSPSTPTKTKATTTTGAPSPPAHQRAHSHPAQPARLALRQAASFVLKEMSRYLPRDVKARPAMGWAEGEDRLGPLRRAERAWGGTSGGAGEGKEQRVFAEALADGVVLCFLLNRLFSTTLQPPLAPSLRRDPASAMRNAGEFLAALGSLGFTLDQQFAPADLAGSPPAADGLHRVAHTLNVLAKMEFDAVVGSSSMKKPSSSRSSSPAGSSRPGSPTAASRPGSPNKVVFVLPSDSARKHRSLPASTSEPIVPPRFIPPYQSLRRVTPPSPLRRGSGSDGARAPRTSAERSSSNPSPTRARPAHFGPSGPLTPPIEDQAPPENDDYLQMASRPSPLAAFVRPRTPSLVDVGLEGGSIGQHRQSIDSNDSFASSSSLATAVDHGAGSGGAPAISVGSVGSASSGSSFGHGPLSTSAKTLKTILSEEELQPRGLLSDASALGHGRPTTFAHSNTSLPSLPSILRPSATGGPPLSPTGIRSAGVRRVSPSPNLRPSASLRRAGSAVDAGSSSSALSTSSSPRRNVPRRGMSVDMAGSGMTMASLVAEAMAAEISTQPADGLTPSGSADSDLGELVSIDERRRPLRRNSSGGGKSYIVRSRSLKGAGARPPTPLSSSQLEGSALDTSAPCTPSHSAFTATSASSRPSSPPQADHQYRRPEFSTRPTPIAHDAYAKPSAFRSAQFALDVTGDGDEHERRRRHSAISGRPSLSQISSDSLLDAGGPRGRGTSLSRDSSSTSLAKGSAHREILTVTEEGKPTSRYAMGNCIGRGQFGSVYRALNVGTGEMVAIKRIRLEGLGEDDIAQLMKEVELVKRLSHPGIVKYEGMSRDEHNLNIVLEYVENGSLGSTLKAFGRLNERLVASYVTKILEGLEYLHSQKVVHCDLKAANILTTKVGNVKLSDFGVSLSLVAVEQKKENDVAGTPNWMAPEVIQMEGASTASDIWSLGCVIIELMTGKPPFAECANGMAVMYRIVEGGPPPVPDGASDELRAFLSQCFEKDPSLRPTAEVLSEHAWLESFLAQATVHQVHRKESIPFLRRRSTEIELRRERRSLSLAPGHRSAGASQTDADDDSEMLAVPMGIDIPGRQPSSHLHHATSHAMSLPAPTTLPPFPMSSDNVVPRAHTFVKSTFSKPVLCRVCHSHVKRSAVLCEGCTLICHASCVSNAPETCDLGAQLMLTAQRHSQSQQQLYSAGNAYPFPSSGADDPALSSAGPSSSILSTSPLTFNISERFFQNLKRSRSPTPSVRRSESGEPSGGLKRFVFPASRQSEERERPSSRQDRPASRQSNRPISRQSRLSRIGRSEVSSVSDSQENEPTPAAAPRAFTLSVATGPDQALLNPAAAVASDGSVLFESPLPSPSMFQATFDGVGTPGQGRLSRMSTRSGDTRSVAHRKKESKDCVIC